MRENLLSFPSLPSDTRERILAGDLSPVMAMGEQKKGSFSPLGDIVNALWATPGDQAWQAIERLHRAGVPLDVRSHPNDLDGLMYLACQPWDKQIDSAEALARMDRWIEMGGRLDQDVAGRTVITVLAQANPRFVAHGAQRGFTLLSATRPVVDYLAEWGSPQSVEAVLHLPNRGGLGACELDEILGHLLSSWQPGTTGDAQLNRAGLVAHLWLATGRDPWVGRLSATSPVHSHQRSIIEVLVNGLDSNHLPRCCRQGGTSVARTQNLMHLRDAWAKIIRPLGQSQADQVWEDREQISDARGLWLAWIMADGDRARQWARCLPTGQAVHIPLSAALQPMSNTATAWVAGYTKLAKSVTVEKPAMAYKEKQKMNQALENALAAGEDVVGHLHAHRRQTRALAVPPLGARRPSRSRP